MTLALATLGELRGRRRGLGRRGGCPRRRRSRTSSRSRPTRPAPAVHAQLRHALGARRRGRRATSPAAGSGPREPRALDAPLLAAMTDAWAPVAFTRARRASSPRRRSTSRSTSAARCRPPGMGAERLRARALLQPPGASAGVWEEDGELWSPAGELLAQSRQLALVREPRRVSRTGFLGLGSNVGDRRANLQAAVDALPAPRRRVLAVLLDLRHRAGRRGARPARLPQRVRPRSETALEPEALLDACKAVERELGRRAGGVRHGPRPIDVDLLLLGDDDVPLGAAHAPARAGDEPALRARPAARARAGSRGARRRARRRRARSAR